MSVFIWPLIVGFGWPVTLSGGEPFIYPDWRKLIEHIKSEGDAYSQVNAISNGYNITEEDIIFLKKIGATHLALSLDGDRITHDHIRQCQGSYERVMKAVEYCHKHGFAVVVVTSFNRYNFEIRNKILDDVISRKIKLWQVQIVNSFGRAGKMKDKLIIGRQQYLALIDDISRWSKKYEKNLQIYTADSIGYCHPVTDKLLGDDVQWDGCNAGKYNIGIEANGNVKGCLSLQDNSFVVGNIRKRSLVDIWNDKDSFAYTRKYDSSKMEGGCKQCIKKEECKAGCLGMAYSLHNSIYKNDYCYSAIKQGSAQ